MNLNDEKEQKQKQSAKYSLNAMLAEPLILTRLVLG
jgi:hypothetical protein